MHFPTTCSAAALRQRRGRSKSGSDESTSQHSATADNNVLRRYLPASNPPNQRKQRKHRKPTRSPQRQPHHAHRHHRPSSTAGGQSPLHHVGQSSAAVPRRLERVGEFGGFQSRRRIERACCKQCRGGHRHEPNGIALWHIELSRHRQAR